MLATSKEGLAAAQAELAATKESQTEQAMQWEQDRLSLQAKVDVTWSIHSYSKNLVLVVKACLLTMSSCVGREICGRLGSQEDFSEALSLFYDHFCCVALIWQEPEIF